MDINLKQIIEQHCPIPVWARRLGVVGFLFFFIKGLLWLIVPGVLMYFGF